LWESQRGKFKLFGHFKTRWPDIGDSTLRAQKADGKVRAVTTGQNRVYYYVPDATPEEMGEAARKLLKQAKDGDLRAFAELADRTIGRPTTQGRCGTAGTIGVSTRRASTWSPCTCGMHIWPRWGQRVALTAPMRRRLLTLFARDRGLAFEQVKRMVEE
jgi:hypothetical protein